MITTLTKSQTERFPEFIERWRSIGLCQDPANRPAAEQGIRDAYAASNLGHPKIVWCQSPLSQGITRAIVLSDKKMDSVWDSVRASVWDSVRDSVGDSVRASVGDSVWDSVWDSVGDSVRASVWDSVVDSVRASVWDSVWDSVGDSVRDSGYGQHDASWLGFYDYFRDVCKLENQTNKLTGLWTIAKNAGWFLPHEKICWISERHNRVRQDAQWRLHCEDGAAVSYPDGWSIYAYHGLRVPEKIIEQRASLTWKDAIAETNAEIRRVIVQLIGAEKMLVEAGAKEVHSDDFGTLYSLPDNERRVIKLINSTPEPTGEYKTYHLFVPPQMERARQAVAWSFGMNELDYSPAVQT